MSSIGAFTFVLHSHIPYARLAGRWPHGEEWIHEAAIETYIPLLQTLYNLKADGVPFRLTMGITPVLAEQLADPLVLDNLDQYLQSKIDAAKRDIAHFASDSPQDTHIRGLAEWYSRLFADTQTAFNQRFDRDIIGAFKRLQDDGFIEIIASAATHAYLPLVAQETTIDAQIKAGIATYERHFGRKPRAFWLPECGYRAGMESALVDNGIELFFTETHTITGGDPVGIAAGDVIGPYGEIKHRYVIPTGSTHPKKLATTYHPYLVVDDDKTIHNIAVIGRNNSSGQQVWSAEWGYPGDFDYREFHKKAGTSGLQYWRVTGDQVPLSEKDLYQPDWARYKIEQHAEHFAHLVGDLLRDHMNDNNGQPGLVASMYDTELFGHWWFEGVSWLGKVLHYLAKADDIKLVTASDYLNSNKPNSVIRLAEGSWGTGGSHFTWDNAETHWMWQPIHEAERRMEVLAQNFKNPTDDEAAVLRQAARELLLMQSSDWQFLITTGQAKEYAIQRFHQHLERFNKLASSLDNAEPNRALADELWELDKVFPDIDPQWFHPQTP